MEFMQFVNQEVLNRTLWGVPLLEWLIVLVISIGVTMALMLVRRIVSRRVKKFSQKTENAFDDILAEVLSMTRSYFLAGLGVLIAALIRNLPADVIEVIGRIVFVLLLVQVVIWGSGVITFYVKRYRERNLETDPASVTTMQAMGFIGRLLLFLVVILLGLQNFGVEITALVASLGIGGIAVALAVQNILGDLFASLSIVLDKPFVVGDFLILGEFMGTVENVGLKTTRLRSLSGEQLIFSNSDLLNSRIRNYKRMYERRVVFKIGVTYDTPYDKLVWISDKLREIVEAQEKTRFDRAHFQGYGDFSLNYEVVYYVLGPEYNLYMDIQQAINLAIYKALEEEEIEFAYPTQTLYMNAEKALPVQTELVNGRPDRGEAHTAETQARDTASDA